MSKTNIKKEAEAFQRVHPKEYLKRFLAKQLRPDGRIFSEVRDTYVTAGSIGTANGSSVVRIGKTIVMCGVKAEIAEPTFEEPDSGFLVPNLEMGPLCSSKIRPGAPTEIPMVYSEILNKILHSCEMFDRKTLCIAPGAAVWCLYTDLVCISDAGNVLDAAILALSTALKNTQIPFAELEEEAGIVKADSEKNIPLTLSSGLYPLTFALFEGGTILADPNAEEEELADGTFTLVTKGKSGEIVYTLKTGKAILTPSNLKTCVSQAVARIDLLQQL